MAHHHPNGIRPPLGGHNIRQPGYSMPVHSHATMMSETAHSLMYIKDITSHAVVVHDMICIVLFATLPTMWTSYLGLLRRRKFHLTSCSEDSSVRRTEQMGGPSWATSPSKAPLPPWQLFPGHSSFPPLPHPSPPPHLRSTSP